MTIASKLIIPAEGLTGRLARSIVNQSSFSAAARVRNTHACALEGAVMGLDAIADIGALLNLAAGSTGSPS